MPNMWIYLILDKQFDMGYNPEKWEYLYMVVWRHYERYILGAPFPTFLHFPPPIEYKNIISKIFMWINLWITI